MGFLSASEQLNFFLCFLKGRPYLHQTCDIYQRRPKYLHIYNPDVHCVMAMLTRFRSWVWELGGELFNPGCWLQVDSTAATSFHSPNKSFTWHWSMIITTRRLIVWLLLSWVHFHLVTTSQNAVSMFQLVLSLIIKLLNESHKINIFKKFFESWLFLSPPFW